jgi:DNA uptake protein ComE-like DNA-binding protein
MLRAASFFRASNRKELFPSREKQLRHKVSGILATFELLAALAIGGCGFFQSDAKTDEDRRSADERTRDAVAKATERAKPELEKAGHELKEAAKTAAEQAHAAAQGMREGWERGGHRLVDINSASESELESVPDLPRAAAQKIVEERPFKSTHELVEKGILRESTYTRVRDRITAK